LVLIVSKLTGFIRDVVLSYQFGASTLSDAYLVSLTIPGSVFAFLAVAIRAIFVPTYTKLKEKYSEDEAELYTQRLCAVFVLISILLSIVGWIFARSIVFAYASGFDKETADIAVFLTRLNLITLFMLSLEYIYEALLQVKGQYIISELTSLPANLILIVSYYCVSSFGIVFFSIGKIVSVAAQFALTSALLIFKYKRRIKIRTTIKDSFRDKNVQKTIKDAMPVMVGTSGNEINKLIDRSVASNLSVGGISSLVYANRLNALVIEICVNSVVTIEFPRISEHAGKGDIKGLKEEIISGLSYMYFFLIPATIVMLLYSYEIAGLIFGHGKGTSTIENTAVSFFYYSFGVLAVGVREIIIRGFYSVGNTRTPAIIAIIAIMINILLDFLLSGILGFGGIALATSVASIFAALMDTIYLHKAIGRINLLQDRINIAKIIIATVLSAVISYAVFRGTTTVVGNNASFIVAFISMSGIYMFFLIIMKSPYIKEVKNILFRKRI